MPFIHTIQAGRLQKAGAPSESILDDVYQLLVQWSRAPVCGVVAGLPAAQEVVRKR